MSKLIELAKKIKALAEQGVDGEKETAQRKLEKFLKDHNLTLDELEEDVINPYCFYITEKQFKLFIQVVANVINRSKVSYSKPKKNTIKLHCTLAEYIEIELKFRHYWKDYNDQLNVFFSAFIHANDIYPESSSSDREKITKEELERLHRIHLLATGVVPTKIHKELGDGKETNI